MSGQDGLPQGTDGGRWIAAEAFSATLREQAARTQTPDLAARVGAATRASELGLYHHLVVASDTLRMGLLRASALLPLLVRGPTLSITDDLRGPRDATAVVFSRDWPWELADLWLSILLGPIGEGLTPVGQDAHARRHTLWLARTDASETGRHGSPRALAQLRWDAPVTALWFPRALLDAPLPGADPEVVALLEPHAQARIARRLGDASWAARVERTLASDLGNHGPELARVARALGVSRATLSRRLSEEGVSFRGISDGLRAASAKRQLAEGGQSIGEIAFGLGFANTAAFHRAFKRWTAMNPGDYRRFVRADRQPK